MRSLTTLLCPLLAMATVACDGATLDKPRDEGGAAPNPSGVMEGTVVYAGRRPLCERDDEGRPVRIKGRVVLTLFRSDDPPPPAGTAVTAENLLTLPAAELFDDFGDCIPADPGSEGRSVRITRSTSFTWPEIELDEGSEVSYQIRGFFDRDEDFLPFFSVTSQPTEGDIAGGAFEDSTAESPRLSAIVFEAASDRPEGQLVEGVTVTLGAQVETERPAFHLHPGTRPLSSEAPLPTTSDPAMAEREIYELTETRLRMFQREADGARDRAIRTALDAAGLSLDFDDPFAYAWYVRDVDLDGDGEADLHPTLGDSRGIQWQTPITLFQRLRTEVEREAGIPDVALIPTVRPTRTMFQKVFFPTIELAVVPVAVVTLNPEHRACRIPYVTPNAPLPSYEGSTTECQEVPTGSYSVNVFQGIAGGTRLGGEPCAGTDDCPAGTVCDTGAGVCNVPDAISDTRRDIQGGQLSGQAWSIPNELSDPMQLGGIEQTAPDQGPLGAFFVHDPDPGTALGRADGRDGCVRGRDPDTGMERDIQYPDFSEHDDPGALRELCCEPVRHLCGVELCDPVPVAADADPEQTPYILRDRDEPITVRAPPESVDSDGVPSCVPFRVPAFCCE
ncbi:MAG: hypothetical protein ACOCUS_04290 [Polyangiales bacterium]